METIAKIAGYVLLIFGLGILIGIITAVPVYYLWNAVVPDIFHLPQITFWQALGLSVLCACLFKSSNGSSSKK